MAGLVQLPFESAERFALRQLLEEIPSFMTSPALDNAHQVVKATELAAKGYEVIHERFPSWPSRADTPFTARRKRTPAERAGEHPQGFAKPWEHISAHKTREAADASIAKHARLSFDEAMEAAAGTAFDPKALLSMTCKREVATRFSVQDAASAMAAAQAAFPDYSLKVETENGARLIASDEMKVQRWLRQ